MINHSIVNEFVCGDDGFFYFFPARNGGGFSAINLREIADELDRMNAPWAKDLIETMDALAAEHGRVIDIYNKEEDGT